MEKLSAEFPVMSSSSKASVKSYERHWLSICCGFWSSPACCGSTRTRTKTRFGGPGVFPFMRQIIDQPQHQPKPACS